jgi:hypothetical protein
MWATLWPEPATGGQAPLHPTDHAGMIMATWKLGNLSFLCCSDSELPPCYALLRPGWQSVSTTDIIPPADFGNGKVLVLVPHGDAAVASPSGLAEQARDDSERFCVLVRASTTDAWVQAGARFVFTSVDIMNYMSSKKRPRGEHRDDTNRDGLVLGASGGTQQQPEKRQRVGRS